jgi:hypothetical protein
MAGGIVELTWCSFQVSALETIVNKGGRMVKSDVVTLTEALMNELVKLDADGDVKVQRRIQEKRAQKHVEPLDAIHAKEAKNSSKAARPTSSLCGRLSTMESSWILSRATQCW